MLIALVVAFCALMAVGRPPARTAPAPTVTRRACHLCVEDTPTPKERRPTLTCDECALAATRAANLATVIARPTTSLASKDGPSGVCASPVGAVLLLGVSWGLRRGAAPPC
jgi:hypothetical protein